MLSYIFGLATMFFALMTWFFWRKGGRLDHIVAGLTLTISLLYVKDIFVIDLGIFTEPYLWRLMKAIEMIVIPLYVSVLIQLIRPRWLSWKSVVIQELPFVALVAVYGVTGEVWWFYAEVLWAIVFGTLAFGWALFSVPGYNRRLKKQFSYTENVDLRWLGVIIISFYSILGLWYFDCVKISVTNECIYLLGNLVVWMFISYFIYRHEGVLDELSDESESADEEEEELPEDNTLAGRIEAYMKNEKAFLNPTLKLSDVASAVGSNRTYVSNYFNRDLESTFFDYVNRLRVEYACQLLDASDEPLSAIATDSGFNSLSTFHRVFVKTMGVTPSEYRKKTD